MEQATNGAEAREAAGAGAAVGAGAAPPGPEAERRTSAGEVVVAFAVVSLCVAAVRTLGMPPELGLAVLVGLGLAGILQERRPLASFGLRLPPEAEGAQAVTLAAAAMGPVLAAGVAQAMARLADGRWLAPVGDLHLELIPYFFGLHVLWSALPEELLFRAYLQTKIVGALGGAAASPARRAVGVVLVAILYFCAHAAFMDGRSLPGIAILGLLLGWLRERTRSIVGPLACHAGYNAAIAWLGVAFS